MEGVHPVVRLQIVMLLMEETSAQRVSTATYQGKKHSSDKEMQLSIVEQSSGILQFSVVIMASFQL